MMNVSESFNVHNIIVCSNGEAIKHRHEPDTLRDMCIRSRHLPLCDHLLNIIALPVENRNKSSQIELIRELNYESSQ